MQRAADTFISNNEREFILKALVDECRLDGRRPFDQRKPKIQFSLDDTSATVSMGTTRVMSVVKATLETPYPDRPTEGPLRFNVEFSPMASPAFEPGRPGEDAIEVARLLDRGLRQSRAVDQEALCVVAGRKVWSLRVDTHVLDHGGNLIDVCFLSALAALMAFRKPEVELGGEDGNALIVHPPEVREPLPLTIHHLPLAVTFAIFGDGDTLAVDPTYKEAAAASGSVTLMLNPGKEVCCVHKADGTGLSPDQLLRCIRVAGGMVQEVVASLKAALQQHEVARVQARVRRHKQVVGLPQEGRNVTVLLHGGAADGAPAAAEGTSGQAGGGGQDATMMVEPGSVAGGDADMGEASGSGESEDTSSSVDDDGSDEDMEEAGAKGQAIRGSPAGGTSGRSPATGGGSAGKQQPRARLAGPLLMPAAPHAGKPGAQQGKEQQAKPLHSNKRGNDAVKLDELEAIAAVIAGAQPGQANGDDGGEPDLSKAIKPAGKRRAGQGKPARS